MSLANHTGTSGAACDNGRRGGMVEAGRRACYALGSAGPAMPLTLDVVLSQLSRNREPLDHGTCSVMVRGTHLLVQVQGSSSASGSPGLATIFQNSLSHCYIRWSQLAMIHVILGPDYSMARTEARQRSLASDPDGLNTSWLDGTTKKLNDVLMAVASVGFFTAGRTIVVEGLIGRFSKSATAEWTSLFNGVPDASTLILCDSATLSVPASVKKALPSTAQVVLCDPPRGRDLVEWIVARGKASGGKIERNVAQTLARTLYPTSWSQKGRNPAFDRPPDMEALGNDVDKLVTAAWPDAVDDWHIKRLIAVGDSDQVFAFIDAASSGDLRKALGELDRLLAAGEDPYKILSQLASSVELAAVMVVAERRDPVEVGRELKLSNANRMTSIARSVREQPRGFAPQVARVLEEIDRQMKTGELRDPTEALYTALARISALKAA